jgi:hypothetical protein
LRRARSNFAVTILPIAFVVLFSRFQLLLVLGIACVSLHSIDRSPFISFYSVVGFFLCSVRVTHALLPSLSEPVDAGGRDVQILSLKSLNAVVLVT